MPIYEYSCCECKQIFEEWQKGFEEHDAACPVCGNKAKRIISNTAFVLKGTGWYATDYCHRSTSGPSGEAGNGKCGAAEGKGDAGKAESGPAAAPPASCADCKSKAADSSAS